MDLGGPFHPKGLDRAGLTDPEVVSALSRAPRHRFVPQTQAGRAYEDQALPIGRGQTISQPYIVGLMTQYAAVHRGSKVLEIGTGSGYQSAVLAELGVEVYSVEIVAELSRQASRTLAELNYTQVHTRIGDGWHGWPEAAPFDAILITAACPRIPIGLLEQLRPGGRMVLPLETPGDDWERLIIVTKTAAGHEIQDGATVRFVPLTGDARETVH